MFDGSDNFVDIFHGEFPYYLLVALPILIICSAHPVLTSNEFTVFRMSQFDVNGVGYGCRTSGLSLEAKSLYNWSTARHCIVAKLEDISLLQFNALRQNAGGLVILLPKNVEVLTSKQKENLVLLEQNIVTQTVPIPVYFAKYNLELDNIIADITYLNINNNTEFKATKSKSAFALNALFSAISANGYHIIVTGSNHMPNKNSKIAVLNGELVPNQYIIKHVESVDDTKSNSYLPTIIITAHLKSFGIYNEYPLNSDAAVFLSIVEILSKLVNVPNATPKYRIIFLLSESGVLLNFQGTKKWLDENLSVQNIDFVLCLDTITQAVNYDGTTSIFMHVSKPPKEGSSINKFHKLLKSIAGQHSRNISIEGVHKKINLAESQLAWEHERFSMRRFPAFTLSSTKNPKHPVRYTIFQDNERRILLQTQMIANIIAEALARYIYKIEYNEPVFSGSVIIDEEVIKSHLNAKSALQNSDLKDVFERYLKNVKIVYDKPDPREPDFMLYDGQNGKLNIYRVKPAIFDLFLTVVICTYLSSIYFIMQYFPHFYAVVCKFAKTTFIHQISNNFPERIKSKSN